MSDECLNFIRTTAVLLTETHGYFWVNTSQLVTNFPYIYRRVQEPKYDTEAIPLERGNFRYFHYKKRHIAKRGSRLNNSTHLGSPGRASETIPASLTVSINIKQPRVLSIHKSLEGPTISLLHNVQ